MNATEYLQKLPQNQQVTFVIARAVPDDATPFSHFEYRSTPIRGAWEWLQEGPSCIKFGDKYIVINADHPPIDVTGMWVRQYKNGHLSCAMLTTVSDLLDLYSEEQAARMVEYYHRTVKLEAAP